MLCQGGFSHFYIHHFTPDKAAVLPDILRGKAKNHHTHRVTYHTGGINRIQGGFLNPWFRNNDARQDQYMGRMVPPGCLIFPYN